ncbi:PD-(D/E)XK nuclease family protein [uncultured Brachyspira sp.]|uniref:PD-(D/E)XK nuclease family protein n=1 Tax=uncultured Brachyspira sp. TaxID=221953 RepID=UPI00262020CA|nr:PD-(D/E)XK nuclease family protein [uncultured Brachyspira sp.]
MKKMHLDIINFLFDKNRELINNKETILNLLLENYESLINSLKEYKLSKPPRINIFKLIDIEELERKNSTILYELLKININNSNVQFNFINSFLKYIFKEDIINSTNESFEIEKEYSPKGTQKSIDLYIHNRNFSIIIENKINSGDNGDNQLLNYIKYVKDEISHNNIYIIYLTRGGYLPSENSLPTKERIKLKNKFINISHRNIAEWLKYIIYEDENCNFIHMKEYDNLKSAIVQIIEEEEYLSSSSEEDTFMQDKLKELLQSNDAYNNISTPEEAQEYIDLIESTIEILRHQKTDNMQDYIDYIKKVSDILREDKKYKFEIEDSDTIKDNLFNKNFSHTIYKGSDQIEGLYIILVLKYNHISVGFDTGGIKKRELGNIIEKIKNYKIKWLNINDNEGIWYDIDINNESAEDTASKMKELYDALKNIK